MDKSKRKTVYICQQCGDRSLKWLGRCPSCQEWNSLIESLDTPSTPQSSWLDTMDIRPQELSQKVIEPMERLTFPITEINRVLGGGLVPGSLVLVGGDPGIGKSTLLLQLSSSIAKNESKVAYISGEESFQQIKLRANRLSSPGESLFVLSETNLEVVLARLEELSPSMVIIDSIQTIYIEDLTGAPGSITQIRECTVQLMRWAKKASVPVFISGHVTKEGAIAGPRALEHIVDVVLYLEGEAFSSYRILRSVKNRFGPTNEVGIFEMSSAGLLEVTNPSEAFLTSHRSESVGSSIVASLEGSRPLLVEIQALTTPANYGPPRRIANGIDFNRLLLIAAILTRRARINVSNQDIISNVIGGMRIHEPAADLGIALAVASSFKDMKISHELVALGEVGLNGELRNVPQIDRRISEAQRLGFRRCIIPATTPSHQCTTQGVELLKANSVTQAIQLGLTQVQASNSN